MTKTDNFARVWPWSCDDARFISMPTYVYMYICIYVCIYTFIFVFKYIYIWPKQIISLVYGLDPATTPIEFDTLYPINALRNVALLQATTPLVMVLVSPFPLFFPPPRLPSLTGPRSCIFSRWRTDFVPSAKEFFFHLHAPSRAVLTCVCARAQTRTHIHNDTHAGNRH